MKEIEMLSALFPAASRRFPLCFLLLISLLSSAAVSLAQSAIVVPNAGFETPNIGSGNSAYTASPSGASWTFANGGGISGNASDFTLQNSSAPEGSQVAFIQITGSISQSLSGFQAGTTYTLTVAAAQRVAYSGGTQVVHVSMDGTALGTLAPSGVGYSDYTFSYTPQTSGPHTLQFLGLNPSGGDNTIFLDNVRFSAVTTTLSSVGEVHFFPRSGLASRMVGGKFQGSSDGSAYTDLDTIASQPADGQWTTATLTTDPKSYRYLRYLAPDGDYGNIAELAFYTGTGASAVKLTGTPFGTPGSWQNDGNDFTKVFDGDTTTFFDAPEPGNGDFVGIDQGGPPATGTGTGLTGQYYNDVNLTTLVQTQVDPIVNFNWNGAAPNPSLTPNLFSVRWDGQVQPLYGETYTFSTVSDDGVRLWVNDQEIVNDWTDHAPTTDTGTITLAAGQKYSIKMEYYQKYGGATAQLSWSSPSQAMQIIPQSQLYPAGGTPVLLPTPYGGSAVTVSSSGTTQVEAENYDLGGEGVAYHDVDNGGSNLYRSDNVGIDGVAGASNGFCVGSTAGGEWDGYTLNVTTAGTYTINAAVGSPTPGGTFHLEFGPVGQVGGSGVIQSGEFMVPNTGSYTTFQTVTVSGVSLPAGPLWMRLVLDSAYPCTFDYFTLSPASTVPSAPTGLTATAGNGSVSLNWTAPAGAVTSYNVKRSTTSGGPYTTISTAGVVTTASYADSTAVNGTTYYYVVSAVNAGGESGNSNEASATPILPASDFSVTASPSNFGLATSGTASTTLTLSPVGTFSGNVTLTVSGLPSNILATFSSASPVAVAAGTPTTDTLTLTTNGASPGPYPLMLTATSGTLTHTIPLTLTVVPAQYTAGVRLTDLFLTNGVLTNRIDWDPYVGENTLESYLWTRSNSGGSNSGDGITLGTDPFLIDSTGLAYGTTYTYRITAHTYYYVTDPYTHQSTKQYVDVPIGTCSVTDLNSLAVDDQAVDSRIDPRIDPHINTNRFLNHNFGSTSYRGGLFAGYNSDPARVGRSLIKFALPALPSGQHPWRVGNVYAYATCGFTAGTSTGSMVACQRVSDTWTGAAVTWSLAPGMSNATNGVAITYDGTKPINADGTTPINFWEHWTLFSDLDSALISSGGLLSVGLFSTDEGISNWTYFAKKEYNPALTPFVLYAYGAPN